MERTEECCNVLMDQKTSVQHHKEQFIKKSKTVGEKSNFNMLLTSYCLLSLKLWHTELGWRSSGVCQKQSCASLIKA